MSGTHKFCMIPGPVEVDPLVSQAMAIPATSHIDPAFIESFSNAIKLLRQVFFAPTGQPFVVAGSGTLAWDMVAANLIEPGESALVINSGIFGDWFGECLSVYGAEVDYVRAPAFGDVPSLESITDALKSKKFKLVTITHVDTSTGVLMDIQAIASLVRQVSPETLIVIDGVCSVAAEDIRMEEWGIDVVLTASQKAIGVPPGLAILVVSQRALKVADTRKAKPTTYFGSFNKWLPIMNKYESKQPSYFATPAVQLILALEQSLKLMIASGMENRFEAHVQASDKVKTHLESLGLKLVPVRRDAAAHSLTSVYYPPGVTPGDFLKEIGAGGVVVAGGLYPGKQTEYFRIGHMNVSATDPSNGHIDTVLAAVSNAIKVSDPVLYSPTASPI